MNDADFVGVFGRQGGITQQVFQWTQNQRERSTQFMGDVGVEAQAFFIQFLFVQTLLALHFQ